MLDLSYAASTHPASALTMLHRSDPVCKHVLDYISNVADMGFQRSSQAVKCALDTNLTLVKKRNAKLEAVSLPVPLRYLSGHALCPSIGEAFELLFHHADAEQGCGFLRSGVLPRQTELLRQAHPSAALYTVVRDCHGYAEILNDHGWREIEPLFDLVRSREHTGVRWHADEIWFKA